MHPQTSHQTALVPTKNSVSWHVYRWCKKHYGKAARTFFQWLLINFIYLIFMLTGMYSDHAEYRHCQNVTWNERGNALMFGDHKIPFVALTKDDEVQGLINDVSFFCQRCRVNEHKTCYLLLHVRLICWLCLIQCYLEHNEPRSDGSARDYPLCSVEVKVAMDGAVDTETCIRRSTLFNSLTPREWCCDGTQAIIWHHVNDNDTVGFMIMLAILWLSRRIEKCAFMWCLTEVYCDPLGSYSVFGFVRPGFREEEEDLQDGELIMASARVHETCL